MTNAAWVGVKGLGLTALLGVLLIGCSSDSDSGSGGSGAGGSGAGGSGGSTAGGSGGSGAGGSGGSTAGGSGGSGAGGSGASAGTGGTGSECIEASDCRMFNDCCACVALAPGEADPKSACPLASCIQSHCDAISAPSAPLCLAGRCVLDVNCDLSGVTCKRAEPECDAGSVPTAVGDCYGGCVPLSECATPPAG